MSTLRIGSRGSDLALWQARYVAAGIAGGAEIVVIKTQGDVIQNISLDKVEGKGFFTKEIESALLSGSVDIAVHSYKDLPTSEVPKLAIAAVPPRAPVSDVVVTRASALDPASPIGLKRGARVGTSALRRKAQLLHAQPDLVTVDLRGNVPTRVGKVSSGELDAVILAEAGLTRLGVVAQAQALGLVIRPIPVDVMTPAAAQGALAIQVRDNDNTARAAIHALHDDATARAVNTERALLSHFGGGCHLPLGVIATVNGDSIELFATVTAPDGSQRFTARARGSHESVIKEAHASLVSQGAARYL